LLCKMKLGNKNNTRWPQGNRGPPHSSLYQELGPSPAPTLSVLSCVNTHLLGIIRKRRRDAGHLMAGAAAVALTAGPLPRKVTGKHIKAIEGHCRDGHDTPASAVLHGAVEVQMRDANANCVTGITGERRKRSLRCSLGWGACSLGTPGRDWGPLYAC